jgi:hypothetical protein
MGWEGGVNVFFADFFAKLQKMRPTKDLCLELLFCFSLDFNRRVD